MVAGATVGAGIGQFAAGVYGGMEKVTVVKEWANLANIIRAR